MKTFKKIFFVLIIGSFTIYSSNAQKEIVRIAAQKKKNNFGIYLLDIGKDTMISIVDSTTKSYEDLRFWDNDNIIFSGQTVIELGKYNDSKTKSKWEVTSPLTEQFNCLVLLRKDFLVIDSMDISYNTDQQIRENKCVLLGYSYPGKEKVLSININGAYMNIKKYHHFDNIQYIYYFDSSPKSVSALSRTIILKVIDVRCNKVQNFDTVYSEDVGPSTDKIAYFNPRYIRDNGNGKLTYLKVFSNSEPNSSREIKIVEWDFIKEKKKVIYTFKFPSTFATDNFRHVIKGNKLYIGFDGGVLEVKRNNRFKVIYYNNNYKLLDFMIL